MKTSLPRARARFCRLAAAALAVSLVSVATGCGAGAPAPSTAPPSTRVETEGASQEDAGDCRLQRDGRGPRRMSRSGIGAPVVLAEWEDRTLAYVADEDERALHVVDIDAGRSLGVTDIGERPAQLIMLGDGRLVVALRDSARLLVLEAGADATESLERRCTVATPSEPLGLALSPDAQRLLVVGGWSRTLTSFGTAVLDRQMVIDLQREPRAVSLSSDGLSAFVSHAVGGVASIADLRDKTVRQVSLGGRHDQEVDDLRKELIESVGTKGKKVDPLALRKLRETLAEVERKHTDEDDGYGRRAATQGYAIARTVDPPGRILLPQVMVDAGGRDRRTPGYGEEHLATAIPAVAVIDEGVGYPFQASLRVNYQSTYLAGGERPERCLLPRGADIDSASGSLLVCCFGSDLLVAYDSMSPDPATAERRRWRVAAGPSGVAVDHFDHRAVVWSQFERTLNVIPLGGAQLESEQDADQQQVRRIAMPSRQGRGVSLEIALGRVLFHATSDARIAQDGRACASCHPDGRDDGLVWATPNGPRRSAMLVGRLSATEPYGWDGGAATLHGQLRQEFLRLGGVGGLRGLELAALIAYLESLSAPAAPADADKEAKRRRGEEIFSSKQAGCSDCHAGSATTDKKRHDVGSRTRADRGAAFDTPSLRFVSAHPPYFHDGRYASLRDLLEGTDGKMGHTKHLSDEDLEALRIYLESL